MFGYVVPEKPELKIKEYEIFRAYYCGVCKSIGRRYGNLPRLTLTYDSAFLAILMSSLSGECIDVKKERCIFHPARKRRIVRNSALVDYAADMNIVLAYYNLKDKWKDNGSPVGAAGMLMFMRVMKKIEKKYPEKCSIIKSKLDELYVLEREKCGVVDQAAEPFAKLMEEILACRELRMSPDKERILRWIGYNMGKWIYVLDAYHDIEEDINKKNYNPLLIQYHYDGRGVDDFKNSICEKVRFLLTYCLNQIAGAYKLFENKNNAGIIENVIYMGMLGKTESILGIRNCAC